MKARLFVSVLFVILITAVPLLAASAQDAPERVVCDSTLATLLLVAEHDYDYLSHLMNEGMMDAPALQIDLGTLQPVANSIIAMMMEEGDMMGEMTDEEMAMHDEMLAAMMAMSPAEMVAAYEASMGMEMMEMSALPARDIAGEDPLCAEVRADVERFILAHLLTEMSMMEGM